MSCMIYVYSIILIVYFLNIQTTFSFKHNDAHFIKNDDDSKNFETSKSMFSSIEEEESRHNFIENVEETAKLYKKKTSVSTKIVLPDRPSLAWLLLHLPIPSKSFPYRGILPENIEIVPPCDRCPPPPFVLLPETLNTTENFLQGETLTIFDDGVELEPVVKHQMILMRRQKPITTLRQKLKSKKNSINQKLNEAREAEIHLKKYQNHPKQVSDYPLKQPILKKKLFLKQLHKKQRQQQQNQQPQQQQNQQPQQQQNQQQQLTAITIPPHLLKKKKLLAHNTKK